MPVRHARSQVAPAVPCPAIAAVAVAAPIAIPITTISISRFMSISLGRNGRAVRLKADATGEADSRSAIDHKRGHFAEERPQKLVGVGRQRGLFECFIHQREPAIARRLVDVKRRVPGSQAWMAALFDVARRAAETADQKVAEALFGSGHVVGGVHRPENLVVRHAAVERRDQTGESFFADERKDIDLLHEPAS